MGYAGSNFEPGMVPESGTIAGAGSYVALNEDGEFILTSAGSSGGGDGAVETYTNSGNNRVITSVNSSTINGEANLTFDGSELALAGQLSASKGIHATALSTSGDISSSGSIVLNDGGSLKEAGGTAAFTFDGSGHVTKIGQDSPSNGQFLKWDGSKAVWDAAGGTTIDNDANNRITTGKGDGDLNAEANLTFDGTELALAGQLSASTDVFAASITTSGEIAVSGNIMGDGDINIDGTATFDSAISGGANSHFLSITTSGDISSSGSIVLNDGGSLKEAGGTAAFTFDGSGHVTKIGQDTPSNGEALVWDNGNGRVHWDSVGGSPAGSDTQIQYNNGGSSFGGIANVTWNDTDLQIHNGGTSTGLTFYDSDVRIHSPGDGQLQIAADTQVIVAANTVVVGTGGDTDVALNFNGNTNDGSIKWFEDEDAFQISAGVLIGVPPDQATLFKGDSLGILTSIDSGNVAQSKYTGSFSSNYAFGGAAEVLSLGSTPVTQGHTVYLQDVGAWKNIQANDDDEGATQMLGIALGTSTTTHGVLTKGLIRMPSARIEGTYTIGAPLYMSADTAGMLTFAIPSGSEEIVRQVGYCVDKNGTTDILLYFNPSDTYIEIA